MILCSNVLLENIFCNCYEKIYSGEVQCTYEFYFLLRLAYSEFQVDYFFMIFIATRTNPFVLQLLQELNCVVKKDYNHSPLVFKDEDLTSTNAIATELLKDVRCQQVLLGIFVLEHIKVCHF